MKPTYRYCPKYQVGTVNRIRLTVINRDPTVLIKAENSEVEEGQPARFVVERLWSKDLLALLSPLSTTVVSLRASQNGQYINGVLPTGITFGQNETSKVIELADRGRFGAFGDDGSVDHRIAARHYRRRREPARKVHNPGKLAGSHPGGGQVRPGHRHHHQ